MDDVCMVILLMLMLEYGLFWLLLFMLWEERIFFFSKVVIILFFFCLFFVLFDSDICMLNRRIKNKMVWMRGEKVNGFWWFIGKIVNKKVLLFI